MAYDDWTSQVTASGELMEALGLDPATAAIVASLRADFPAYEITPEATPARIRYAARRLRPGPGPHTVITADPGELREALSPPTA
jgi:hypothetical protein